MTERNQNEQEQQNTQQQETTTEQEQTQQEQRETQARKFVGRPEDLVITPAEEVTEAVEMEQEDTGPKAVHHATVKGANLAVARKEISADSCRAVIAGELSLQQAKVYGRDADRNDNPVVSETSKKKAPKKSKEQTPCMCGECGLLVGNRFAPGHDARVKGWIVKAVRAGTFDELSPEIQGYAAERGLVEATQERMAAEEVKRAEKIKAKAEAQREKEGAAEAKKRASTIVDIREGQPTDDELDALNSEDLDDQE